MQGALTESPLSFDEFRTFIEDLATTEGRLVVSGAIVFFALVIGTVLVPYLVRGTSRTIRQRLLTEPSRAVVDTLNDYIPTTISHIVRRTIQVSVLFVAGLALLIIWGLVDLALAVVQFVGLSVPLVGRLLVTFVLFLLAYIALDVLEDAIEQFSKGADRVTEHQEEIILRMGHVGILAVVFMGALTLWGLDLSGLLVGAGFLGIVIGLAAQQTIGSLIAGFVLMFSQPFTIGDWIAVGNHEGIVTKITIMNTRLQNFDGETIVIPNDVVGNQPITNRTRQGILRTHVEVGIDYQADPEHAEEVALEAIKSVESVASSPPPQVVPTGFGDSAVVLDLRFWIDRPNPPARWHATTDVIHVVKERFEEEGIKIPYPQRELSGRAETDGFRVRGSMPDDGTSRKVEARPED